MTIPDAKSDEASKPVAMTDLDVYMTSEQKQKQLEALGTGTVTKPGGHGDTGTVSCQHDTWRMAFRHFAQITTLHGVRFVGLESAFIIRRLLWLVLFLLCSSLMGIQIVERIVHYYGYPVTVNVNVNFNKTLAFPALTVCNQNAFRATAATERDIYHFIEKVYNNSKSTTTATADDSHQYTNMPYPDLARADIRDLTLDDLFRSAAHRKEDLIVGCEWEDEPCGPENFTESLTDHGVCYTFNGDPRKQKWVSSAGSEYGIKLTLNVEQYEYMPGPHNAAGVKILLHNKKEFPKVAELGLAVSPGMHAYLGMQLLWIQNLPEPHGTCRSQDSPFYSRYSPEACQLACMSERLGQLCGCRHMYMPHVRGSPPICTMENYLTCYKNNIGKVKDYVQDNCKCPVPCDFLIYDPTISFASTSVYATDQLLASTTTKDIQRRFLYARETTERMNHLKFNHFLSLETDMRTSFERLKKVMTHDVKERIQAQKKSLQAIFKSLKEVKDRKRYLLEWQAYHVNKNFMRARNAMEERTMMYLMMGFQEYSYQVEARIYQMATTGSSGLDQDVRTSIYYDLMNLINGRVDLAERAFANYTQLYGAYFNGTAIFRYKFKTELRADNLYITPRPLLRDCLFRTAYTRKFSSRVGKDIMEIKKFLLQYSDLANTSYINGTVDEEKVHLTNVMFMNRGRRFYQSRSEFYIESVEYPLRVLNERIAELDRRWRLFQEESDRMLTTASHTLDELNHLEETILYKLQDSLDITQVYISEGNVSKMRVATELTSTDVYEGINNLIHFFTGLRARGQDFYSGWSSLANDQNAVWDMVLNDPDLDEFYNYKNITDFLQDYTTVAMETEANYTGMRDSHDFRFLVGNLDSVFLKSLEDLMKDMHQFIDQSSVDADFIKKNFLQLDVFYREKSYEHIMSQEAYDIFALFCDIGGSMGLFVGASVLTLYEVIDLIFHQSLITIIHSSLFGPWIRRKMRTLSYSSDKPPPPRSATLDVGRATF